jgi:predicted nucleic acid-binding protein
MADSIMLATARAYGASLWTQDADFQGLPDVRFRQARPR